MNKNLDLINFAVSLIIKAALKMQATPSLFRQWLGLSRAALLQACLFAFDVFLLSISHPFLEIWDKEQSHLQPCRL